MRRSGAGAPAVRAACLTVSLTASGALLTIDFTASTGNFPVAVSADALQVYAGLGILTGAASADEQARLDAIVLSHAHIDHAGRLPYLVAINRFDGMQYRRDIGHRALKPR